MPRRLTVRRSALHGRGAFALADFDEGELVTEYRGTIIGWDEAEAQYDGSDAEAGHTFYFALSDGSVIDGGNGGNSARWINHGCEPNCEAIEDDGRIFIYTLRSIRAGEELLIDYRLMVDDDAEARAAYACLCQASACRGTMIDA